MRAFCDSLVLPPGTVYQQTFELHRHLETFNSILRHICLSDPTMHPKVRAADFERRPCSDFRHVIHVQNNLIQSFRCFHFAFQGPRGISGRSQYFDRTVSMQVSGPLFTARCYARRCHSYNISVRLSVRLCVRPSVTRRYCTKTNDPRMVPSSLTIPVTSFWHYKVHRHIRNG